MKITWTSEAWERSSADLVAVPYARGAENTAFSQWDRRLKGAMSRAAEREKFDGGQGKILEWQGGLDGAPDRVVAFGVGKGRCGAADWRAGVARAVQVAARHRLRSIDVYVDRSGAARPEDAVQWSAEALSLAAYRYDRYRTKKTGDPPPARGRVGICPEGGDERSLRRALEIGVTRGSAVAMARDLVNAPANELSPEELARRASDVAAARGLESRILDARGIRDERMGLLLAVAAGSAREPRFVHLVYRPAGRSAGKVALVGKGITFDSGGLCVKQAKGMSDMKTDMAGAAAVVGAIAALADLRPAMEVHAIVPVAENAIGGGATRPGDVVVSRARKTVEIVNTDAEGRLILADALSYAADLKPEAIIDLATLTGACVVALGPFTAGVFSNDERLAGHFMAAAERAGELAWRLPLVAEMEKEIKSDVADLKNLGGRDGGAVQGALFLRSFVGKTPWVHVDIAGPARAESATPLCPRGGTGYGVLTCVDLVLDLAERKAGNRATA